MSAISQNANGSPASKQVENYADSLEKSKKSVSDASKEAAELASSLIEVAKAAGNGDSVLKILADKGPGIAKSLGSEGAAGGLTKLGAAFLSVISPTSLLAAAVTTLIAFGVEMIDWPKLAAGALNELADVLIRIAPYAAGVAIALALIYAPSIVVGLIEIIAILGNMTAAAGRTAISFTAAWLAAIGPIGWLVLALGAVLTAIIAFRDSITRYIGIDVVDIVKQAGNLIIGSFVAAFEDIKFVWSNFGTIIGAAVEGAVNAVVKGVNSMIQKAALGIDELIGYVNKIPGISLPPIGDVGETIKPWDGGFTPQLSTAVDVRNKAVSEALNREYLTELGGFVKNVGSAGAEKVKGLADWSGKADDKTVKKGTGAPQGAPRLAASTSASDSYGSIVADANKRIASLEQEQAALGMTEQAAAKMRYETELLNKAQEKNIALTPEQKTELSGLAEKMASVEAATKSTREAMDFAKDLTKGFISDLKSGLKNGESFWKSFSTAAVNALNKIADKLLNDVLDSLFKVNSAASGGGGIGGFFSSLFGFGGGGGFNIGSNATALTSGFDPFSVLPAGWADGGYTGPGDVNDPAGLVHAGEVVWSQKDIARAGGVGIVEAMRLGRRGYADGGVVGPQLVRALPDASVPVRRLRADNQNDASGSASGVHVTVGVSVDEDGNLKAYVKNVAQTEAKSSTRQGLNDFNQQLPDRVAQINRNPRRR